MQINIWHLDITLLGTVPMPKNAAIYRTEIISCTGLNYKPRPQTALSFPPLVQLSCPDCSQCQGDGQCSTAGTTLTLYTTPASLSELSIVWTYHRVCYSTPLYLLAYGSWWRGKNVHLGPARPVSSSFMFDLNSNQMKRRINCYVLQWRCMTCTVCQDLINNN